MTKIIAVTGATGAQGGGVANVLLKTPGWKVRAITRNTSSDKAKDLESRGAEVVQANFDDEDSVAEAFKGAHAIFAVTNFWEHLFTGKSQAESGEIETKQALTLAKAASRTATLEHYIWSTLPSAKDLTNGKAPVPHFDYKAEADKVIKKELPELAKKTTFLFVGYYPSNVAFFPMLKLFEFPGAYGKYGQIIPGAPDAKIPVSGDMTVTPGVFVRQILANPSKTLGRYVLQATEISTFGKMLKEWSEVTGKPAVYCEVSSKTFEEIWGIAGKELAEQFTFGELVSDWTKPYDTLLKEDLGIIGDEAPNFKTSIEGLKAFL